MRHAARFGYIFVKIHVVQCATLPYNSHMHGSLSLGQLGGKISKPLEHNKYPTTAILSARAHKATFSSESEVSDSEFNGLGTELSLSTV